MRDLQEIIKQEKQELEEMDTLSRLDSFSSTMRFQHQYPYVDPLVCPSPVAMMSDSPLAYRYQSPSYTQQSPLLFHHQSPIARDNGLPQTHTIKYKWVQQGYAYNSTVNTKPFPEGNPRNVFFSDITVCGGSLEIPFADTDAEELSTDSTCVSPISAKGSLDTNESPSQSTCVSPMPSDSNEYTHATASLPSLDSIPPLPPNASKSERSAYLKKMRALKHRHIDAVRRARENKAMQKLHRLTAFKDKIGERRDKVTMIEDAGDRLEELEIVVGKLQARLDQNEVNASRKRMRTNDEGPCDNLAFASQYQPQAQFASNYTTKQ